MKESRREWRAQIAALRNMSRRDQRSEVRRLLRCNRLHLHLAFDALRRCFGLEDAVGRTVVDLAARFNAFAPVDGERVIDRIVRKGSGTRCVQDFGPHRRMQQAAVADILRFLHPPPDEQFLFNGGMPAALRAVAKAYRRDGFTHGVEIDFVNFYGSVTNVEALADLLRPLPTSVVEHVVWDKAVRNRPRQMVVVPCDAYPTSRRLMGLSLGASTSPVVGERIIAELLAVAGQSDTITYADNLFVLGRSDTEVAERIHRIRESVASAKVGALELRQERAEDFRLGNTVEFLKHRGEFSAEGVVWGPGPTKISQYQSVAADRLTLEQIGQLERQVKNWRRSYPDWQEGERHEAEYLAGLAVRRFYLAKSWENRSGAVRALQLAWLLHDGIREIGEFAPEEGDMGGSVRDALVTEAADGLSRFLPDA